MSEAEDELIDNTVDPYCAADELQGSVIRVAEYEMISVE